jgi:hypothetical protein
MRRLLVLVTVLIALLLARAVEASAGDSSESRGVVVVVVAPEATELDVVGVRAAIGLELGSDAVSPDDPRASSARGRIEVSIDQGARQLVVSYRGASDEALVRRIDLPGDAQATLRAAVLLAGNLARDEATELVEELHKAKAEAARASSPASPPTAAASSSAPAASDARELAQSEYLRRLLAYYAAKDRRLRLVVGWTLIGIVAAADGSAVYLKLRGDDEAADTLVPLGIAAIPALLILGQSSFERMSAYYEGHVPTPFPQWLRADVERRWKREAESARRSRIGFGVAAVALGVVGVGLGVMLWDLSPRTTQNVVDGCMGVGGGTAVMAWGIVNVATESNLESRLHEYERGLGHPIEPAEVGLRVTPVRGGVVAGLGGSF